MRRFAGFQAPAILALEAKLLAADEQPYNLAALRAAYAAAVASLNALTKTP